MKLFNRWDMDVEISDPGLREYVNVDPVLFPRSAGRYAGERLNKDKISVIERLVNKIAISGHRGKEHKISSGEDVGKKRKLIKALIKSFEIIEEKDKKPVNVLIKAIENTAPLEETTSFQQGGIRIHKSVVTSPQRRVDLALRFIAQGVRERSFKNKLKLERALAEELLAAASNDQKCYSIKKKTEKERLAEAAR